MTELLQSSLEERKRIAADRREKLYSALRRAFKNIHSERWAIAIGAQFKKCRQDHSEFARTPHFRLLNSVEACFAYSPCRIVHPVTLADLGRVMNIYHDFAEDTLQMYLAGTRLYEFAVCLFREQIEVQQHHGLEEVARNWELFGASGRLPELSRRLIQRHGLSPSQWIQLCYLVFAHASNAPAGWFHHGKLRRFALANCGGAPLDTFLRLSSRTPDQIRAHYKRMREQTPALYHSLIRSNFLEAPLIEWGFGAYQAVDPYLVFRHSGAGLYQQIKDLPDIQDAFSEEFGNSVETYVGRVLSSLKSRRRLLTESDLQRVRSGQACDFLVETEDCIILVETKATTVQKRILTEENLVDDGSTRQIVKGMEQLGSVYSGLETGKFAVLGLAATKPVYGIVATFGEVPFANSDWYFEDIILKRGSNSSLTAASPTFGLPTRPMVMCLRTLEQLVTAMNNLNVSLAVLVEERAKAGYQASGEWDQYLGTRINALGSSLQRLSFVEEQAEAFYDSMGIPKDARPTAARHRPLAI